MVDEESKSTTDKPENSSAEPKKADTSENSTSNSSPAASDKVTKSKAKKSDGSKAAQDSKSDAKSEKSEAKTETKSAEVKSDAKTDAKTDEKSEAKLEPDLSSLTTKERQQIHISKILDEVLELPDPPRAGSKYKHPMYLDLILAAGLLVAMGGFTIGLFKIYITHSAQENISQHNYKAAISILRGSPVPDFFAVPGSSPQELLNKALYLDAMEKLDANPEDQSALHELQKITKNSTFFETAQDILKDKYKPARMLEGGASHDAIRDEKLKPSNESIDGGQNQDSSNDAQDANPASNSTDNAPANP